MAKHEIGNAADDRIEKKSKFDQNRTAFVDPKTGDYVFNEWVNLGTDKYPKWDLREVARIPAEMGKWVKLLDEDDAAVDLQNRYEDEHRDYTTENKKQANQEMEDDDSVSDDGQSGNPMEDIPDRNAEPEKILSRSLRRIIPVSSDRADEGDTSYGGAAEPLLRPCWAADVPRGYPEGENQCDWEEYHAAGGIQAVEEDHEDLL